MNVDNFNKTNFSGINMQPISKGLWTLENNDMLKAAGIDLFCTDTQRTMLEYKNRGKNAAIEMGFREYTGTFIVEFSAALFAFLTSKIASKNYKPDVIVNSSSWITNKGLDVFNEIYKSSDKSLKGFIESSLNNLSGIAGDEIKNFKDIEKEKTAPIINSFAETITKNKDKKEYKKAINEICDSIIKLLGADNNIIIKSDTKELKTNLSHGIRDLMDATKNIFFSNTKNSPGEVLSKLKNTNKLKTLIAIPLSIGLAATNQFINRKLTKKRTGIDNFVGENDYMKNVEEKNESKKEKGLFAKKLLSAGIFTGMLAFIMGIKNPSDLIQKLEFNGPATTGNTIKTIYGSLILGRIFASKDSNELRETNTRDYLGFLNWLVLGDFVSKGAAQIFDRKQKELFNITNNGKGIKHWLYDTSLKSQKEIIAQGKNVKKNLRNLNVAQLAGIGYSALMLGFLLPKFNIMMTKRKKKNEKIQNIMPNFEDFIKNAKNLNLQKI